MTLTSSCLANDRSKTGLTAVDLFSGIGGFHIAAHQNGIAVVFASEIDAVAADCYQTNLGLVPEGDITLCKDLVPPHDILMAGFPCQPFSIMGKGDGLSDQRGKLVFEAIEIADRLRPTAVILENVKRFAYHINGETIRGIVKTLEEVGYIVEFAVLNALDFGLPQKRERTFIVALEKGTKPLVWPTPPGGVPELGAVLEKGRVPARYYASKQIQHNRKRDHRAKVKPAIWHENRDGEIASHSYSGALRAGASHNYLLVNGKRRLTEREMLRLQGFPEHYVPMGKYEQTKRQVGNAVPVPVASAVIGAVVKAME